MVSYICLKLRAVTFFNSDGWIHILTFLFLSKLYFEKGQLKIWEYMGQNRNLKHLYIYSQMSFHMAFFCTQLKWLNMCCILFNCGFNTQSQKRPNCFNELIFVTSIIFSWIPLPQKYNYNNFNYKKTIGCLLKMIVKDVDQLLLRACKSSYTFLRKTTNCIQMKVWLAFSCSATEFKRFYDFFFSWSHL